MRTAMRKGRVVWVGALVALAVGGAAAPAPAAAALTPIVDCMEPNPDTGTRWVYFGYTNDGAPMNIEFGAQNQVLPGFGFQGQPTVFNTGSYPRVFRAVWNQNVFTAVAWDLNNVQAVADEDTPFCASGATGPASDVSTTGATLNGVVNPRGIETTYSFEYGPTIAYGQSTPAGQVTSGSDGVLVSASLSGLKPGTTYHYRLAASGTVATVGEDRTFTTDPEPAVVPPRKAKRKKCKSKRGKRKCRKGKRKP